MTREDFIKQFGDKITEAEEGPVFTINPLFPNNPNQATEIFLLFSQQIPSQNLGFLDAHATNLELTVGGRDFTIHQSPTILSSNRAAGTTGAVLWKITPLIAEWISLETNFLRNTSILTENSAVLELGCGISGLIGLTLAPHVRKYTATDQAYVLKILRENLETNAERINPKTHRKTRGRHPVSEQTAPRAIQTMSLDWELDDMSALPSIIDEDPAQETSGLDLIIACDCIYNDALIAPFVRTCTELCRLRQANSQAFPTVCLIAQQLRSAEVLEIWLKETMKCFDVWRLSDDHLIPGLREDSGFVVHVAILRS